MAQGEPSYDVFISYSHADREWVWGWLTPRLKAAGVCVCIDDESFDIGVPSLVNMERAAQGSRHTLVVLTPAWVASEWTEFEALLTQTNDPAARRRRLLPLLLEACSPPPRIAMLSYADFRDEARREGQLARLVDAMQGKLGLAEIGPRLRELLPPEPALHTLRAAVGDFTGRADEIRELVGHLSGDGGTATITGIHGMGGIGKTELALVVAHELTNRYPDAALFYELQPGGVPLPAETLLGAVIRAFQPELRLPDELSELRGLYHSTLAKRRGVLLLDNAAGPDQVRPLLQPKGWAVLVTSRLRFALHGAHMHDLKLFPLSDAIALLRRMLSDGGRHDLATANLAPLAERCGRLPLALRLAADFLTTYVDWSLSDYQAALNLAPLAHLAALGEPSLQAVLGLSITQLRKSDPALADRWEQLVICPAPFDRAAAAAIWGTLVDTQADDMDTWPALTPLSEVETRTALSALVQRSLLDYARDSETYTIHDLLRACIFAALTVDLDEARQRHAWHYLRLGRETEDRYQQGGEQTVAGLRQFEMAWPHLAAAWTWQRDRADRLARRWVNAYPLSLLERSGRSFYLTAEYKNAKERYREALALASALEDDPRRIAGLYSELAATAYNMGEGEENLNDLDLGLAVLQKHEIPTERLTIELQADRISTLEELGKSDAEESVVAYGRLLDEAARLEPTPATKSTIAMIHSYRAISLGNLGCEWEAAPDYRRAAELCEEVGDWRMAGICYLNLASAAYSRMRLEDFDEPLAKGVEYSEKVGDLDNLNWAKALRGATLLLRDRAPESEQMLREAIEEAQERDFGWNLVGMHVDLAAARLAQGRAAEAKGTAKQAMDLAKKDKDPLQNGWAYMEFGRAESALGNHAAAESYLRKAIKSHREAKQRNMVARAKGYLGQALLKAGRVEQGVAELTEAIATLEALQLDREADLFRKSLP